MVPPNIIEAPFVAKESTVEEYVIWPPGVRVCESGRIKAEAESAIKVVVPSERIAGSMGSGFVWVGGSLNTVEIDDAESIAGRSLLEDEVGGSIAAEEGSVPGGTGDCVGVGVGVGTDKILVIVGIFGAGLC